MRMGFTKLEQKINEYLECVGKVQGEIIAMLPDKLGIKSKDDFRAEFYNQLYKQYNFQDARKPYQADATRKYEKRGFPKTAAEEDIITALKKTVEHFAKSTDYSLNEREHIMKQWSELETSLIKVIHGSYTSTQAMLRCTNTLSIKEKKIIRNILGLAIQFKYLNEEQADRLATIYTAIWGTRKKERN